MLDVLIPVDAIPDRVPTLSPTFACSCTDGGPEAAWVHVAGELDLAGAPQLEWTLRSAVLQAGLVVLDLRGLTFIDCRGVHAVLDASNRARRAGRRLVLLRGPRCVDRVFMLTGCSDQLEIGDLDQIEPPAQVLLQLAEHDLVR